MSGGTAPDIDAVAAMLPPYAHTLGMQVERLVGTAPVLAFDYSERVLGRPGFIHGGAIGGLLEMAAIIALRCDLIARGGEMRLKPVSVTVEYLRGGTQRRTFALGRVTRAGRRIANVSAEVWQDDPAKPIASAWMNVLLSAEPG